ncbi:conserved hypothetical protein, membrane [Candidatus Thiomargarita nelsonii]|uniref:Uncharacterized protein n=1 Tax=Candidatus Thiomargarita nelsonii TaxID=1003181 RepID=A0A176RV16_9GAMM|nr:conserved hypothetical protein, membrane [Candidatus Thiomargarita nelsonii]
MMSRILIISIQLLAFWPVWQWYIVRLMSSPEDRWGLLAVGTLVLYLLSSKRTAPAPSLLLPTLLTLLYAVSYPFMPPLLRAAIALIAVGSTFLRVPLGAWGLLLLSLPLIPSLQFYLGYPLRLIVASVAAPFIRLSGFAVVHEGVYLNWHNYPILISPPPQK